MLISLDREWTEVLGWEESLEFPDDLLAASSLLSMSAVSCRGGVEYVSPGFLLTATLGYEQEMACTRCLKPIRETIENRVEALLMTPAQRAGTPAETAGSMDSEEVELDQDQLNVVTLEEEEVDTAPLVFEQIQLQVPMKPICRPDCLGLCPRCGSDRNETADCCSEKGYDSRWSGLEGLKDRLQRPDS